MIRCSRTVFALLAIGMLLSSQTTVSADEAIIDPDLSANQYGLIPQDALLDPSLTELVNAPALDSDLPELSDPWCADSPPPDAPTPVPYDTFTSLVTGQTTNLLVAEYDPATPGEYLLMVFVHGGAWAYGCWWSSDAALKPIANGRWSVGDQKFIVLSIDYRLDCVIGDQAGVGTHNYDLCGWDYRDADTRGDNLPVGVGAAIHDVESAVKWAKTSWAPHDNYSRAPGTGITLAGFSAGGHLAAMVGALEHQDTPQNPNGWPSAVVSLSGPAKNLPEHLGGYTFADPCNRDSQSSTKCWSSINQFLRCVGPSGVGLPTGPQPGCNGYGGTTNYYDIAFADRWYRGGTTDPSAPIFFANGGGPQGTYGAATVPELVPLSQAYGFSIDLGNRLFPPDQYKFCIVDSKLHVTYLFMVGCEGGSAGAEVWDDAAAFVQQILGL